jgi:hypothetical protein
MPPVSHALPKKKKKKKRTEGRTEGRQGRGRENDSWKGVIESK